MRGQPVTRHLAAYWLRRAYELAKVEKPTGSLWHVFRRVWATERKHLAPRDVATAGGWSDIGTLLSVYQQVDEETLREVVDYEKAEAAPLEGFKVPADDQPARENSTFRASVTRREASRISSDTSSPDAS